jgi:hypothetical protein
MKTVIYVIVAMSLFGIGAKKLDSATTVRNHIEIIDSVIASDLVEAMGKYATKIAFYGPKKPKDMNVKDTTEKPSINVCVDAPYQNLFVTSKGAVEGLKVIDIRGQCIALLSFRNREAIINAANLRPGIYAIVAKARENVPAMFFRKE